MVLTTQPTADVIIGLSPSDPTEGTVSSPSLTFTSVNWNTPQTVTGDRRRRRAWTTATSPTRSSLAAANSADLIYNGIDPADVAVTNTDNDAAGIIVTPTSGLTTTESGGTATFTIVLASQPTADVTIALSIKRSDRGHRSVLRASGLRALVKFTGANWNTPVTITVTGVDDVLDDGNVVYTIVTAAATSADVAYNGLNAADVTVTSTDNDASGITVTPTSGLTTTEGVGTATFTVGAQRRSRPRTSPSG